MVITVKNLRGPQECDGIVPGIKYSYFYYEYAFNTSLFLFNLFQLFIKMDRILIKKNKNKNKKTIGSCWIYCKGTMFLNSCHSLLATEKVQRPESHQWCTGLVCQEEGQLKQTLVINSLMNFSVCFCLFTSVVPQEQSKIFLPASAALWSSLQATFSSLHIPPSFLAGEVTATLHYCKDGFTINPHQSNTSRATTLFHGWEAPFHGHCQPLFSYKSDSLSLLCCWPFQNYTHSSPWSQ